jgi:hypothetical protein
VDRALLAICVFGIFQSVFLPEFGTRLPQMGDAPAWEYQGRRLVSTLLDPNFAGAMTVLALMPGLSRVAEGLRVRAWTLLVPAAALVLTASRSSVLALGVAIGTIVLARGLRWRLVKTLGIGALLLLPAVPALIAFGESMNKFTVDASAAQRLVTWKRAFTLFAEHPILGIGFNATRQAQASKGWIFIGGGDTAFDGGLLFVMVMTGIIGALLYVLLLGRGIGAARRLWRDPAQDPDDRAYATATAASVMAIVAHSLFSNTLLLPYVMQVLWVRFGRIAHLAAERRRRLGIAVALPLVAVTACDPCFGVTTCTTDFRARLQGSVVDYQTGAIVPGTEVRVTFTGAALHEERVDTTDAEGLWDVSVPTTCCDRLQATAIVHAPGQAPYLVPGFDVKALSNAGDAQHVGRWINRPAIRYGITFLRDGVPLADAGVTFQATGGVPFEVLRLDPATNFQGIFRIDLASDRVGNVLGTLTVTHPSLPQPWRMQGVTVPVDYIWQFHRIIGMGLYDDHMLLRADSPDR